MAYVLSNPVNLNQMIDCLFDNSGLNNDYGMVKVIED